ncbi:unknown protein [Desulfotalea psychrophila LSv54]|uniref:VWFA domain-containing protein n=2 Tax=Desulfotalea psychrophila TaxID=84980 RepID=Q6AN84_DESPS|nr:unknown protein [Desulfotalea psychrophila LSv54]
MFLAVDMENNTVRLFPWMIILLLVGMLFHVDSVVQAACVIDPTGTYIEAENYTGEGGHSDDHDENFSLKSDGSAHGGLALVAGSDDSTRTPPRREIKEYEVEISTAGTYYFWMRGEGYSGSRDSMFYTVDDSSWRAWNFAGHYYRYVWTRSMQVGSNGIYLSAGSHTIKIAMREHYTRIDGFFLSTNRYTSPSFANILDPTSCQDSGGTLPPADGTCGDVPIYTQNLLSPAIMVQLDLSGSMDSSMFSGSKFLSSDLAPIVQEIVDLTGWVSGHNIAFRVRGTGDRQAYSYRGSSVGAPVLTIKYIPIGGVDEVTFTKKILADADDNQVYNGSFVNNYYGLYFGAKGPVGLLFKNINIPSGAEITSAEILFTYRGSDDISRVATLDIEGFKEPNVSSITETMLESDTGLTLANASLNYTRLDYAVAVLAEVFKDDAIAWGFATWAGGNGSSSDTGSPDYYSKYKVGVKAHSEVHQGHLETALASTDAYGWTPLTPSMNAAMITLQQGA